MDSLFDYTERKGAVLFNDTRPNISFKENRCVYYAKNPMHKSVLGIQVDGKLIDKLNEKKCDKGLLVENAKLLLIELKGIDVNSACSQLLNTYYILKNKFAEYDYACRCVLSKSPAKHSAPRMKPTSQRKLESELKASKFPDRLRFESIKMEETV